MPIYQLPKQLVFPNPNLADESGILAIGGDLSPKRLLLAYQNGIFPWFNEQDPILWWSPDPRMVLFPSQLVIAKSMRSIFNQKKFRISVNENFRAVMQNCGQMPRQGQNGTWISPQMLDAYQNLHELGFAHSVEAWQNNELVGGLYGIILGKCFFGESMFSNVTNASKAAFITLIKNLEAQGFELIDCQVYTQHLESLGAKLINRSLFLDLLKKNMGEKYDLAKYFEPQIKIL